MIYRAEWRNTFNGYIVPRLSVVHKDLTNMAAWLRDVNVDIWTETPTDGARLTAGRAFFSLEGWRIAYKQEYTNLNSFNTSFGALVLAYDSQAKTALDGYLVSIPIIGTAFDTVMAKAAYRSSGNLVQRLVLQADRNDIATAIEGQLQA